jgi:hypothetical protein
VQVEEVGYDRARLRTGDVEAGKEVRGRDGAIRDWSQHCRLQRRIHRRQSGVVHEDGALARDMRRGADVHAGISSP